MEKPKLILFDIGGVFIEYANVFKTASIELSIPIKYIDDTFDRYDREITTGLLTPQELYIKCITENNLDINKNYNFLISWLNDYIKIMPTHKLVYKLSEKYEIGLLSNIYKGFVPEMIKQDLLPDIKYKYFFLSCDIGMQKPDKKIYKYVLEITKLKPNEILLVDDKEENTNPAEEIGWQTLIFQRKNPDISVKELTNRLI